MVTITSEAGPWHMTVFCFEENDPENPLGRIAASDIARLPFGAAELDRDGRVVAYYDTEPDDRGVPKPDVVGRRFFDDVAPWAGTSAVAREFAQGVERGELNVVFDCAVAGLDYKLRIHFKISPILATYWVFIKKLKRNGA
ncbi:MAG: hypothetical protein M0006_07125 [Magnetospirillum sp.]|nr:hypothetical protein [Magnetospirillum sp.]